MNSDRSFDEIHRSVSGFLKAMPIASFYGIVLDQVEAGTCTLKLPFRPELSHDGRAFQASISGALADFAGGLAIVTLLPPGHGVATIGYELHLLVPAYGSELIARGQSIRLGRTVSLAHADVFSVRDGVETHCATAIVSLRTVPPQARKVLPARHQDDGVK